MKKKICFAAATALLLLAALFSGCRTVPASAVSNGIVGTWKDAYGLTQYQFYPDGSMRLKALSVGSFRGRYSVQGPRISIRYRVLLKEVNESYALTVNGDTMYLDSRCFTRKE